MFSISFRVPINNLDFSTSRFGDLPSDLPIPDKGVTAAFPGAVPMCVLFSLEELGVQPTHNLQMQTGIAAVLHNVAPPFVEAELKGHLV